MRVMTSDEFFALGFSSEAIEDREEVSYGDRLLFSVPSSSPFKDICKTATTYLMAWRKISPEWDEICKRNFDKISFWRRLDREFDEIKEEDCKNAPIRDIRWWLGTPKS